MRHDFDERDQGRGQPGYLSVTATRALRALSLIMLGAALAGCVSAAPSPASAPSPITRPIVLVSGRDNHGLLAGPFVSLQRAPDDPAVLATVADGTFARTLEVRGEWLRVQVIAAPETAGWVNDYYLRDRALRTDGGGQVEFVDARLTDGEVEILVRPVNESTARPEWLLAAQLREVGKTHDLRLAQKLARHQSISTTQRYAHADDPVLDRVYERVFGDEAER